MNGYVWLSGSEQWFGSDSPWVRCWTWCILMLDVTILWMWRHPSIASNPCHPLQYPFTIHYCIHCHPFSNAILIVWRYSAGSQVVVHQWRRIQSITFLGTDVCDIHGGRCLHWAGRPSGSAAASFRNRLWQENDKPSLIMGLWMFVVWFIWFIFQYLSISIPILAVENWFPSLGSLELTSIHHPWEWSVSISSLWRKNTGWTDRVCDLMYGKLLHVRLEMPSWYHLSNQHNQIGGEGDVSWRIWSYELRYLRLNPQGILRSRHDSQRVRCFQPSCFGQRFMNVGNMVARCFMALFQ